MTSSAVNGRRELLRTAEMTTERSGRQNKRIGEVAGGTAAECAMVCCCCPCAVLHLLLLALYKVPTGLCRKIWRNNKRKKLLKKKKKNDLIGFYYTDDDKDFDGGGVDDCDGGGVTETVGEFETEMWDRFYGGGGFGRSKSQREED